MKSPLRPTAYFTIFVAMVVGFFCIINLIALLQPTHFLKNLEPYPDGLLYSLSARNLAQGKGMQLVYEDSVVQHWVPPLYTLVLSSGYLISSNPSTYVVINTLLGAIGIWLIGWIVLCSTKNMVAAGFAVILYASHAVILWLPSLPMSENLAVLLLVAGIAGLIVGKQKRWIGIAGALVAAIGLVLTRNAVVPVAGGLSILAVLQLRKSVNKSGLIVTGIGTLVVVALYSTLVTNPLRLISDLAINLYSGNSPFYSLQFLISNTIGYFKALIGIPSPFLWNMTAFTSIFASMGLVILPLLAWKLKRFCYETIVVISLFLAQFPLMLVFYTLDTRYIIYSLPLIALAGGWSVALIAPLVSRKWLYLGLGLVLLAHVFTQVPHFKQILSANVLGRTVGWQYQAITSFDHYFAATNEPAYLITAIPPFLVDAYSTSTYRVLPLSPAQEFIAKGQWVWGTDTDPERWMSSPPTFRNPRYQLDSIQLVIDDLLVRNEPIFISNAYITHLPQVIKDYETWKEQYVFEAVQTGCEQACDMYRIKMKDLSTTKIE